jgi:hypothetical protein
MVNSLLCGYQCGLQPFTVQRDRRRGARCYRIRTWRLLTNSSRYNERPATTLSQRDSFSKPSTAPSQPGVNRLYLPVSRRATSLFLLHRQQRAGGQGPSALTEIPATAGFHHEGAIGAATADPRRCMSSVIVDIQKTVRPLGKTDMKDVFMTLAGSRGLTAFD